jgi:hypothetical protein
MDRSVDVLVHTSHQCFVQYRYSNLYIALSKIFTWRKARLHERLDWIGMLAYPIHDRNFSPGLPHKRRISPSNAKAPVPGTRTKQHEDHSPLRCSCVALCHVDRRPAARHRSRRRRRIGPGRYRCAWARRSDGQLPRRPHPAGRSLVPGDGPVHVEVHHRPPQVEGPLRRHGQRPEGAETHPEQGGLAAAGGAGRERPLVQRRGDHQQARRCHPPAEEHQPRRCGPVAVLLHRDPQSRPAFRPAGAVLLHGGHVLRRLPVARKTGTLDRTTLHTTAWIGEWITDKMSGAAHIGLSS